MSGTFGPCGGHTPVLLREVVGALSVKDGGVYVDATFGGGGYSHAILEAANCRVVALDRDASARERSAAFVRHYGERFSFVSGCFGDVDTLLSASGPYDGLVLDLGVSSFQLDEPERGFSFQSDGPLDMRMGGSEQTAADLVNSCSESELADIFFRYGEEPRARSFARAITKARTVAPFRRTRELADLIKNISRVSQRAIHPATRVFMALRIAVNEELVELERALQATESLLSVGGRLVVVAFHSLEDRIVKDYMKQQTEIRPAYSRYQPPVPGVRIPHFRLLTPKAIQPSEDEVRDNPRSRSAKLRAVERIPYKLAVPSSVVRR